MLAEHINKLVGKDIYIKTTPETLDWTSHQEAKISLVVEGIAINCPLSKDLQKLRELFQGLQHYIGDNSDILVIGWNIKSFMSYAYGKLGMEFEFAGRLVDLKIAESFCGIRDQKAPETIEDAKTRITKLGNLEHFVNAYREVYYPLATQVLPKMESVPLADQRSRSLVYSSYEIEGSINGRLKTPGALKHSYLPHTMKPEDKENLWPQKHDDVFLYADYKNMEVAVLQWLSGDKVLGEILDSGKDIYSEIWKIITKQDPDEEQRESCKRSLLSIVYGAGSETVAKHLNASERHAELFMEKLEEHLPQAMNWIRNQMDVCGVFTDSFGRKIRLEQGKEHKLQNYAVSSPAAMICLHKLVKLERELTGAKLVFHVHDGYGILVNNKNVVSVAESVKNILESEDELYPGLRLRVACEAGRTLDKLILIRGGT
jgi:hypothetical protein